MQYKYNISKVNSVVKRTKQHRFGSQSLTMRRTGEALVVYIRVNNTKLLSNKDPREYQRPRREAYREGRGSIIPESAHGSPIE